FRLVGGGQKPSSIPGRCDHVSRRRLTSRPPSEFSQASRERCKSDQFGKKPPENEHLPLPDFMLLFRGSVASKSPSVRPSKPLHAENSCLYNRRSHNLNPGDRCF